MTKNRDSFTRAYIETALELFRETVEETTDSFFDQSDLAPETLEQMQADCVKFYHTFKDEILSDAAPMVEFWDRSSETERKAAMAGYDFWLTRCGHGAGFWDGDWPEPDAEAMTAASEAVGYVDLHLGDDGKIWA